MRERIRIRITDTTPMTKPEQKVIDDVAKHGWHVINVMEEGNLPGFSYSIGLTHTFEHPEVIVFGLKHSFLHQIVNNIGDEIRAGKSFQAGSDYEDILEGYPCRFRQVPQAIFPKYVGWAIWFHQQNGAEFSVLQCVWPDREGRFPWEPSCHAEVKEVQPILDQAVA